jgi:DNA repair protein RadD
MKLEHFQQRSVDLAIASTLKAPLIVVPTGGGKSHIAAALALHYRDCLILSHDSRILRQNANKIPLQTHELGIFCAELNSKNHGELCTVASIQSAYNAAHEFARYKHIILDESHLCGFNSDTRYRKFFDIIQPDKIIGMTATPYRLEGGHLVGHKNSLFDGIAAEITYDEVLATGRIVPARGKEGEALPDMAGVEKSLSGDLQDEQAAVSFMLTLKDNAREIVHYASSKRKVLIFTHTIEQCEATVKALRDLGQYVDCVHSKKDNTASFTHFHEGMTKYMVNVGLCTTGYDFPLIDMVVLLRSTLSPALYVQMAGRGARAAQGKEYFTLLDYGNNMMRHGSLKNVNPPPRKGEPKKKEEDLLPDLKVCRSCREIMEKDLMECPSCGYIYEPPPAKVTKVASAIDPMTGVQPHTKGDTYTPTDISAICINGKNGKAPSVMIKYYKSFDTFAADFIAPHSDNQWAKVYGMKKLKLLGMSEGCINLSAGQLAAAINQHVKKLNLEQYRVSAAFDGKYLKAVKVELRPLKTHAPSENESSHAAL